MTISEAIVLYLKHHPGSNKEEFFSVVESESDRDTVRAILDETITIPMEWGNKSITEIWQEAHTVIQQRHPDLSPEALKALANYFAYNVK